MNDSLKHRELTDKILGTFYEVYNELGFGFLESVYENTLFIALETKGLKVEQQVPIPVWFRAQKVGFYERFDCGRFGNYRAKGSSNARRRAQSAIIKLSAGDKN